jgi:hypothetical protein
VREKAARGANGPPSSSRRPAKAAYTSIITVLKQTLVTFTSKYRLLILIFISLCAILIIRREVIFMRCEYKDDFNVEYSGSLHITKGDGIDVVVKADQIPANYKACLDSAVSRNSCHELRAAAKGVTNTFHEAWEKE